MRALSIVTVLVVVIALARSAVAREEPQAPFEEVEFFEAAGGVGVLVMPAGAPDMRTPAIIILHDALGSDGRSGEYVDQLLAAGLVVLDLRATDGMDLGGVIRALATHPRIMASRIGLLGFGDGARQVAEWPGPVAARALLYPGCASLMPAQMPGEAVLLIHGDADRLHAPAECELLAGRLGAVAHRLRWRPLSDAGYAWDRPVFPNEGRSMLPAPDGSGRIPTSPWPASAELYAAYVSDFFATTLLGRGPGR